MKSHGGCPSPTCLPLFRVHIWMGMLTQEVRFRHFVLIIVLPRMTQLLQDQQQNAVKLCFNQAESSVRAKLFVSLRQQKQK